MFGYPTERVSISSPCQVTCQPLNVSVGYGISNDTNDADPGLDFCTAARFDDKTINNCAFCYSFIPQQLFIANCTYTMVKYHKSSANRNSHASLAYRVSTTSSRWPGVFPRCGRHLQRNSDSRSLSAVPEQRRRRTSRFSIGSSHLTAYSGRHTYPRIRLLGMLDLYQKATSAHASLWPYVQGPRCASRRQL
jgi:hypothetical protein